MDWKKAGSYFIGFACCIGAGVILPTAVIKTVVAMFLIGIGLSFITDAEDM